MKKTQAVLVLVLALLPGASSLRLEQTPVSESFATPENTSSEIEPFATPANETAEIDFTTESRVPPISVFRSVWNMRYSLEHHLEDPLPSSIKMILGVFTVVQDAEYRTVVRQTWLQQKGVCYWTQKPRGNCSVYTAFVMGKSGTGHGAKGVVVTDEQVQSAHDEEGMIVLDIRENMNNGKSLFWFRTALEMFPWATHIGKMDMDTYPFLHKLVNRMATNASCVGGVSPYEFIGRPHNTIGRNFTRACAYEPCLGQFTSAADHDRPVASLNHDWKFLSGEFYIMSMPLVQKLQWALPAGNGCPELLAIPNSGAINGGAHGNEDVFAASVVNNSAQEGNFCVALRRLDAWFHRNDWVNEAYSNDFVRVRPVKKHWTAPKSAKKR